MSSINKKKTTTTIKKTIDFPKTVYQMINAESNNKNITIAQFIKRWTNSFPFGATERKSIVTIMEIPDDALTNRENFDKFFEDKKQEFIDTLFLGEKNANPVAS